MKPTTLLLTLILPLSLSLGLTFPVKAQETLSDPKKLEIKQQEDKATEGLSIAVYELYEIRKQIQGELADSVVKGNFKDFQYWSTVLESFDNLKKPKEVTTIKVTSDLLQDLVTSTIRQEIERQIASQKVEKEMSAWLEKSKKHWLWGWGSKTKRMSLLEEANQLHQKVDPMLIDFHLHLAFLKRTEMLLHKTEGATVTFTQNQN